MHMAHALEAPLMTEAARPPAVLEYNVVKSSPHDRGAFTQGLILRDGFFYESTGLNGRSSVRKVKPETGEVVQHETVPREYFAEGLTDWKGKLIQLTWQSGKAFVYDLKTFKREGEFAYSGEGWGITHDDKRLIMSDGSDTLQFIDTGNGKTRRTLAVKDSSGRHWKDINELEWIDGNILANVWHQNTVLLIDGQSGLVKGQYDLGKLAQDASQHMPSRENEQVLNGIAWNPASHTLLVTGKDWPVWFELKITLH